MKEKKRSWRDRETNEADGGEEGEKCQDFTYGERAWLVVFFT